MNKPANAIEARAVRQKQEIKTIKPHSFTLELSNNDFFAFNRLAIINGTTPEEILTGFINDLIDGTYSRGSDERMLAESYFERCGYGILEPYTFLRMTAKEGNANEILELMDDRNTAQEELEYLNQHPDKSTPELVEDWKEDLRIIEEEMQEIYQIYCEECKLRNKTPESYEKAFNSIPAYAGREYAYRKNARTEFERTEFDE